MVLEVSRIRSKTEIAPGIFDFWLDAPQVAQNVRPGQFVTVGCEGFTLRRPISICDAENGRLRLVVEARGDGTRWIAQREAGETLSLLGPLGNGFFLSNTSLPSVFVGGGIGTPPMLAAAKPFGAYATVILGFRSASAMILKEDFERLGASVTLCTDDGTAGRHGVVTAPLEERLDAGPCKTVYACGPKPMLKAVAAACDARGIPCMVSMEERMACGVGACHACACKVKFEGREQYFHVCSNGPVFSSKMIVW